MCMRIIGVLLVFTSCNLLPGASAGKESTAEQEFEVPHDVGVAEDISAEAEDAADIAKQQPEASDDGGGMVDEWEKTMEGFTPELLLTFPLPARYDEFFYEELAKDSEPVLIRGGFFATAGDEESSVDVSVLDPKGKKIYEASQAEGIFHFVASVPGIYVFNIGNRQQLTSQTVTFTVGKGNSTHLQKHHINTVEERVKAIDKRLLDIQTEATYLWIRQKSHMKAIENIHNRVFAFCVLEFLILTGVASFQVYYIKGLLSDKRVL